MAVDFPTSPSNGQTFTSGNITYTYNATAGLWNSAASGASGGGGSSVTVSDTAPTSPSDGDMWYNSLDLNLYVYYNDGSSSQWVQSAPQQAGVAGADSTVAGPAGPAGADGRAGVYADMAALIAKTGMVAGDQALVTALNKVFMYTGTAWYLVATMTNASPTAITGVSGSYNLATDGTATTITAVSTDPEGFPLTWSYAVTTGSLGSTATVSQADNVFTITPSSTPADAGSFSITFSVTDGATGAVNAISSFTLAFIVQNSRYTALSVKATGTGSNQTFDDASTSNHTITVAGDTTASTFSPYRHGGYSLKFENSVADDNNIKFNNTTGSGAVAASGEFCVETWVKFTANAPPAGSANARIFASNGSGGNAADNLQLFPEYSGSYIGAVTVYSNDYVYRANSTPEVINDDQWHHLAVTRDSSNNLRWFVDGSLITTIASNTTTFQFEETRLGKRDGGTGQTCFTGDMRDTRVVIGSSVYESAFTPPTEPLTAITNTYLLVGDLPYIKDESTNNFSIHAGTYNNGSNVLLPKKSPISLFDNGAYSEASHGASAYFDGTGDHISAANHADFNVGSSDFTLECWAYIESINGNAGLCGLYNTSTNQRSYLIYQTDTSNHFGVAMSSDGTYQSGSSIDSGVDVSNYLNQWVHLALTKSGTNATLYLNGNSIGTTSSAPSTLHASTASFVVGKTAGVDTHTTGYFSDVRLVNGSVVYTSNFTPPTAPLTAITNTKFLLNPETSILDLSQSSAIKCVGDAATSTTQVKFAGTKSIAFDGTGDNLLIPNSPTFGSEDFTIEGWMYFSSLNTSASIVSRFNTANNNGYEIIYVSSTGKLYFQTYTGSFNTGEPTAASNLSLSTWYHFAAVRQGTNKRLFIDGTQLSGYPISIGSGAITGETTIDLLIGDRPNTALRAVDGYVQDVRITKGLARYTSNFTPPTTELEG